MISDNLRDRLFCVIEECVDSGATVQETVVLIAEAWRGRLLDRAALDRELWDKKIGAQR